MEYHLCRCISVIKRTYNMKKTLNKNVLKIALASVDAINKSGISVETAYVFGSHAKATARMFSDIDLCIVSEKFGHDRQSDRIRLMEITDDINDAIEPHPFSPEEMESRFDPLVREIKMTGIEILPT